MANRLRPLQFNSMWMEILFLWMIMVSRHKTNRGLPTNKYTCSRDRYIEMPFLRSGAQYYCEHLEASCIASWKSKSTPPPVYFSVILNSLNYLQINIYFKVYTQLPWCPRLCLLPSICVRVAAFPAIYAHHSSKTYALWMVIYETSFILYSFFWLVGDRGSGMDAEMLGGSPS